MEALGDQDSPVSVELKHFTYDMKNGDKTKSAECQWQGWKILLVVVVAQRPFVSPICGRRNGEKYDVIGYCLILILPSSNYPSYLSCFWWLTWQKALIIPSLYVWYISQPLDDFLMSSTEVPMLKPHWVRHAHTKVMEMPGEADWSSWQIRWVDLVSCFRQYGH